MQTIQEISAELTAKAKSARLWAAVCLASLIGGIGFAISWFTTSTIETVTDIGVSALTQVQDTLGSYHYVSTDNTHMIAMALLSERLTPAYGEVPMEFVVEFSNRYKNAEDKIEAAYDRAWSNWRDSAGTIQEGRAAAIAAEIRDWPEIRGLPFCLEQIGEQRWDSTLGWFATRRGGPLARFPVDELARFCIADSILQSEDMAPLTDRLEAFGANESDVSGVLYIFSELEEVGTTLHRISEEQSYIRELVDEVLVDAAEIKADELGTVAWIQIAVTRIGAVGLAIFGVQILISFFRYFMKTAALYESRAVALLAFDDDEDKEAIQKFLTAIRPESVTFGKEPDAPIEQVVEMAKALRS